jgi:hypothetical protein
LRLEAAAPTTHNQAVARRKAIVTDRSAALLLPPNRRVAKCRSRTIA